MFHAWRSVFSKNSGCRIFFKSLLLLQFFTYIDRKTCVFYRKSCSSWKSLWESSRFYGRKSAKLLKLQTWFSHNVKTRHPLLLQISPHMFSLVTHPLASHSTNHRLTITYLTQIDTFMNEFEIVFPLFKMNSVQTHSRKRHPYFVGDSRRNIPFQGKYQV